jgi:hypothetical protein
MMLTQTKQKNLAQQEVVRVDPPVSGIQTILFAYTSRQRLHHAEVYTKCTANSHSVLEELDAPHPVIYQ